MKKQKSVYVSDKRYPGIRKRSLGVVEGFGEDWTFYAQYRSKGQNNKVIMERLGTASEGWTIQKAYLEKEKRKISAEVSIYCTPLTKA